MSSTEVRADFWLHEFITPWDYYAHGITRVFAHRHTKYQEMYIVETGAYGKALVLDGKWQSCTADEFLYHEALVHPALLLHGRPRRVLILGGGEGATAREVLRWRCVQTVCMVDIDGEVVEACRQHLPEMHAGAFDDPRLTVRIEDALKVLDEPGQEWDVILSDLSDPIEEGPSFKLFTREYFQRVRGALAEDGVFVVQAGPLSPPEMQLHVRLNRTVASVFPHVRSYWSFVPSFAAPWGFVLGRSRPLPERIVPDEIDRALAAHVNGPLRMLDGTAMAGMFSLPRHIREAIAAETNVYTLETPPRFFGKSSVGDPAGANRG